MAKKHKQHRTRSDSTAKALELASMTYDNLPHPRGLANLNDEQILEYYTILATLPAALITTVQLNLAMDLAVVNCLIMDVHAEMHGTPLTYVAESGAVKESPLIAMLTKLTASKSTLVMKLGVQTRDRAQIINHASSAAAATAKPVNVPAPSEKSAIDFAAMAKVLKDRS